MPLPVIADTFRCTLNWSTFGGVTPRNVFHLQSPTAGEEEVGTAIHDAWTDDMAGCVSDQFLIDSVTVLKLDGTSAGIDTPMGAGFAGQASGDIMPSSALVLSLKTGHRGPSGRGRMYLGPTTEADCSGGFYDGSVTRTDIITAWANFAAAVLADTANCLFGVASYHDEEFRGIFNIGIKDVLGTQRRRQDQLRH